jgi:HEAT repeat protein
MDPSNPPRNAIWALGQTGSSDAIPPLAALRDHPDPTVRYLADEALRNLD